MKKPPPLPADVKEFFKPPFTTMSGAYIYDSTFKAVVDTGWQGRYIPRGASEMRYQGDPKFVESFAEWFQASGLKPRLSKRASPEAHEAAVRRLIEDLNSAWSAT